MYIQEGSEIIHLTSKQLYIRVNIVAGETDAHSFLGFSFNYWYKQTNNHGG